MPKQLELMIYQEDGWKKEEIENKIKEHSSVKEYIIAFHDKDVNDDGTPLKPHFHVYLNFGNTNWTDKDVAKWFGIRSHLVTKIKAESRGNLPGKYAVARYYTHLDYPSKHYYPPSTFVASFNVEEYLNSYVVKAKKDGSRALRRFEDKKILERCASGEITPLNYYEKITALEYARSERQMNSIWKYHIDKTVDQSKGVRNCKIIWICGESGVGKTTLAALIAEHCGKPKYVTSPGSDPLGGYRQEPVIVVDELRPDEGFSYKSLLQFLDPYNGSAVHSRYHDKYITADLIFVCSVYSPKDYYAYSVIRQAKEIDSDVQLYRRITQVWNVSKDRIEISKYNSEQNRFIVCDSVDNPVPRYVEQKRATTPHGQDPLDALRTVSDMFCGDCEQLSLFDNNDIDGNIDPPSVPTTTSIE